MISGLDLLFLEVNSLEESLAFYAGVLGMEVESVNNDSEPPMAKLRAGGLRRKLQTYSIGCQRRLRSDSGMQCSRLRVRRWRKSSG